MKKIELGQLLGVLANLAVVAGIIFLSIQIREDRTYAVVENTIAVGFGMKDWLSDVAHDAERADILMRGSRDFQGLTELERYQFDLLMRSWIITLEMGEIARSRNISPQGSGPGGESLFMTGNIRRFLDLPGTREWWKAVDRRGLPRGSIAYIDDYIRKLEAGESTAE